MKCKCMCCVELSCWAPAHLHRLSGWIKYVSLRTVVFTDVMRASIMAWQRDIGCISLHMAKLPCAWDLHEPFSEGASVYQQS